MKLENKVALVTGGAIRIGRFITLALAEAGCNVFIHYGRSVEQAQQTKSDAEALGVKAFTYSANLADAMAVKTILPEATEQFGRVDILVNNAAIFLEGDLANTTLDMWESQFAINLRAPFLLSQDFAAQIPTGEAAAIVNVGDGRVMRPGADYFAYRLTKAALVTMTETLALDLAPNISVNAVALGAILPPPGEDPDYLETIAKERIPLNKPGNPESVAQNVLHLLRNDFLTGVVIRIDGGEFL
jgi:glucose 1-dehydrogenase